MNKKLLNGLAVVLAIIFIVIAFIYWFTKAGSLPAFFPGFISGSSIIHLKHGIASFLLGLVLFAYVWFNTAKK